MKGTEMDVEELVRTLDPDARVEHNAGGYWACPTGLDVRAMAGLMFTHEVRLVTLTARPEAEGSFRVIYHWDTGPAVLNVSLTLAPDESLPSIADIIPGADWAEREIRDYYDVAFSARAQTPTLMLLPGDPPGLFSRTAEVGRDVDPATTARRTADSQEGGTR
jgi:Ni,Fe-hydrogenase III component G